MDAFEIKHRHVVSVTEEIFDAEPDRDHGSLDFIIVRSIALT
jgi:hypothetical protein